MWRHKGHYLTDRVVGESGMKKVVPQKRRDLASVPSEGFAIEATTKISLCIQRFCRKISQPWIVAIEMELKFVEPDINNPLKVLKCNN